MSYKYFFISILFLFLGPQVLGQTKPRTKDSVGVYKKIETYLK